MNLIFSVGSYCTQSLLSVPHSFTKTIRCSTPNPLISCQAVRRKYSSFRWFIRYRHPKKEVLNQSLLTINQQDAQESTFGLNKNRVENKIGMLQTAIDYSEKFFVKINHLWGGKPAGFYWKDSENRRKGKETVHCTAYKG